MNSVFGQNTYAELHSANPDSGSGFTNNWLTERSNKNLFRDKYSDFNFYKEDNSNNITYRDILKTIQERCPVSDLFFSKLNLNHLKVLICRLVKSQAGYVISPQSQSDNELLTIMRAIYLEHGKNLPENVEEQVGELNRIVLYDVVPRVISSIKQHLSYRRDHGAQPLPMDRPSYDSSAGTKSNRSITSLFI